MTHIVVLTAGYTSYLNACFHVADQLRQQGHRVTFVSGVDVSASVSAQGFDFVLLTQEAAIFNNPARQRLNQMSARQRYRRRRELIDVSRNEHDHWLKQRELDTLLDQLAPDLLLIEEELSEHIVVAASRNVPTLLLQYWTGTRRGPGNPPLGSPLVPSKRFSARLKIGVARQKQQLKQRFIQTFARYYYRGTDRRSTISTLAQARGFDTTLIDTTQWWPVTFRHVPTLYMNAWELDLPNAVCEDDKAWHVGPQVYTKRQPIETDAVYRTTMQEFMTPQVGGQPAPPLIYCGMGSVDSNEAYLTRVIQAFALRPNYRLIISTGHQVDPSSLGPLPSNTAAFRFVPQLEILQHADLMLCHGGIATINECIFYGVPMIVYPANIYDRNSNAARVVYHNLGVSGNIYADSPAQIATQIDHVLTNPCIKTSVKTMQDIYQQYRQADKAVTIIEGVMNNCSAS